MNHVQLHQTFILRHRDKRDTASGSCRRSVKSVCHLSTQMAGHTPANEHSNLSVSDFMQGNKLPACTFVSLFFSPFIFHLKAASKLPASVNIGFGVFVSNGEYSAVLFTQGC